MNKLAISIIMILGVIPFVVNAKIKYIRLYDGEIISRNAISRVLYFSDAEETTSTIDYVILKDSGKEIPSSFFREIVEEKEKQKLAMSGSSS